MIAMDCTIAQDNKFSNRGSINPVDEDENEDDITVAAKPHYMAGSAYDANKADVLHLSLIHI